MRALSVLVCWLVLAPYALTSCTDAQSAQSRDAEADANTDARTDADASTDADEPRAVDCQTLEQSAQGFELQTVTHAFSSDAAPRTPSGTARNISPGRIYQRVHVAQYGGTADVEPPLPTLIAFSFDAGSNQLSGAYCVVQATKDKDGGSTFGHYEITFVPRSPGSTTDFVVSATMKPPNTGKFPIGFDGDAKELTIYVQAAGKTYLETYVAR